MRSRKILIATLMIALLLVMVTACSPDITVTGIAIKEGTLPTELIRNEEADFSGVVVVATLSDGKTEEIVASELTFSAVSTETVGDVTVTVSYKGLTIDFTLPVVYHEASVLDGYYIAMYEMPSFVNAFNNNISASTSGENSYFDKTEPYFVGSANNFVFMPKVTVSNDVPHSKVLTKYRSDYQVEKWTAGAWEILEDAELVSYVQIIEEDSAFKFTALSNGEKFRLTFTPREIDMDEYDIENSTFAPLSFTVSVIDGYNVYNAADLSVFDNFNANGDWTDYKTANNISLDLDVNGIILHNNITITVADLPKTFFYEEADMAEHIEKGSMKKWTYMYTRAGDEGEIFNFIGNYFSIDVSAIPLGTKRATESAPPINNSQVFNFIENSTTTTNESGNPSEEVVNWATNNIRNITFIGNATRATGEDAMVRMGGLIMIKSNAHMLDMYNVIMRRNFTDIYVLYENSQFNFEKCKAYDSYSNSMLFWENAAASETPTTIEKKMLIKDSEIKRCGGPALILNDYDNNEKNSTYTSSAYIEIESSVIESFVTGEEGWFTANNASSAMAGIKGLDTVFNAYGKTYMETVNEIPCINFMVLMMPDNPLGSTYTINTWVKIDGVLVSNITDPYVAGTMNAVGAYDAPVFQSSVGGVCYFDGSALQTGIGPGNPVLQGEYITVYPKTGTYIGALFQYHDLTP